MGTINFWLSLALLYLIHITGGGDCACVTDTSMDGTLMRHPEQLAVYQIIDGCRRLVPSIRTYRNLYKNSDCIKTNTMIRNLCRCGRLSSIARLIKGSGPAVYLLSNGVKRHIANPDTFNGFCFDWDKIRTISDSFIDRIPTGSPINKAPAMNPP